MLPYALIRKTAAAEAIILLSKSYSATQLQNLLEEFTPTKQYLSKTDETLTMYAKDLQYCLFLS